MISLAAPACAVSVPSDVPVRVDAGSAQSVEPDLAQASSSADLSTTTPSSCGQQTYALMVTRNAPNIHLVIDRSGSMSLNATTGDPPDNGQTSKWDDLSTTLSQLFTTYGSSANQWGMSIFPTAQTYESCTAGSIAVPLGPPSTTLPQMLNVVGQYNSSNLLTYDGKTPTTAAIQGVIDNVQLNWTDRNNYVVLMTDGMPDCMATPETTVTPLIAQLYAQTPAVRTFVIGFGSDTQSDPTLLNDWAVAGHTDQAGNTKYYQAGDATTLSTAFQTIITGVASCTFNLATAPADPSLVSGEINGQSVPSDPVNGFSYDAATQSITFHGTSCTQIESDASTQVGVIYGCPPSGPVA